MTIFNDISQLHTELNGRMTVNDVEACMAFNIISQNLFGGTEENYKNQVRRAVPRQRLEIRISLTKQEQKRCFIKEREKKTGRPRKMWINQSR